MLTVPDLLSHGVTHFPDKPAMVNGERRLSFAEVDRRANQLVQALKAHGVGPEDRFAVLSMNQIEYLEWFVAAMRSGATLVPLNFRLALPELDYIVSDCTPKVIIAGDNFGDVARQLPAELHLTVGDSYESALRTHDGDAVHSPAQADSALNILYTSGTTGRPKGAVITNHAMYARLNSNAFEYSVRSTDALLQCLPLFHIANNVSLTYTMVGGTNHVPPTFEPAKALALIESERLDAALFVPTMINTLINHPDIESTDLSSLRTIVYGASPIPPSVLRTAIGYFGQVFVQQFGMTETSGCTTLRYADHDPDLHPDLLSAAGTEALGFEVRIVDLDDNDVGVGEVGEILCRGASVMDRYWNAPEATAEALKGGWMHTGDLGYRAANGYVYVTDRKKDMIVTGGENVYPREVEDVLFQHPDVLEAAVIGVPDPRWGERVHAILVAHDDAEIDPLAVQTFARERLGAYKTPKSIEVADSLPKNAIGKVLKRELRAPFWADHERAII